MSVFRYYVLVVSVWVEEDSKACNDACDDGDCGFVDGEVVVFDEGGGDGVKGEE